MIFRIKSQAPVTLETIAFADIVINLFVFFFVTFGLFATFDTAQKGVLPIQLPKGGQAPAKTQPNPVIIMIDRSGILYLGSQKISISKLQQSVNRELSFRKEKSVLIRADQTISLKRFVSILDVIRTTKARAVTIETKL